MSLRPEDTGLRRKSSQDSWNPRDRPPGAYPHSPSTDGVHRIEDFQTVHDALRARKDEYVRKKTIKVKVGTWNVAAIGDTHRDLGAWFAQGLGVKGLAQDLAGLRTGQDLTEDVYSDSDIETVEEQEARHRKKSSSIPHNDVPGVAHGDEVDLYVLGLQEVIDITSMTEAVKPFTDPNPARKWKSALKRGLPRGYKKVVEEQLLGLLLLVFASPRLAPEVSSVDSTHVGTGLMGYLGNKGAVSARILLGGATRILFVNCHLAAGADSTALARRIWDANQITAKTKFAPVGEEWVGGIGQAEIIGDEDMAFWFGDLNYRLDDIPGEDVRRLLLLHARNEYDVLNASKRRIDSELGRIPESSADQVINVKYEASEIELPALVSSAEPSLDPENDPASLLTTLKSLLTHDQLKSQQRLGKVFHEGWREGDINFLPTYKYDIGSVAMFDSGEKKRSPSWCDRILYRTRRDYEEYARRVSQETKAKDRDEDMKRRGLDEAVSQDDVLFDYNPDTDGGDDYDDDFQQHQNDHDIGLVRTKSGVSEDALMLEEYISHQRVLTSDHKPLSAVFSLTYDSVDAALKAQVFQKVTREFDRAENEARPSVTLVVDNDSHLSATTDKTSDTSELRIVDFGEVRYGVQYEHHLTIANTGQIEVKYAFMDNRMNAADGTSPDPFPSWLHVRFHQDADSAKSGPQDLGNSARFRLLPGETTSIDLLVEISQADMVTRLNSGDMTLDDVLVLRISGGRDHFLPVKGLWQQTCFYWSIDELVRVPAGVRECTMRLGEAEAQRQPSGAVLHSAPQELFALTDVIPRLAERVVAEWEMHHSEPAPWRIASSWPFAQEISPGTDFELRTERLAEIREALDTAESLDSHLSPQTEPGEKLDLLAETLTSFLVSLRDGIITISVWEIIEARMHALEKNRSVLDDDMIQEIVMEAVSMTPVHSVSLTFLNFMLNTIMNDIFAAELERATSPATLGGRSRSSTSASAMSDVSLSSVQSTGSGKKPFLSFGRRSTNMSSASSVASPISPVEANALNVNSARAQLAHSYAEFFAPMVIRSDEAKLRPKERKAQLVRKVRVLEAFLNQNI